jgi:hypothetical protein
LLDHLLGFPYKDWNAYYAELVQQEQAAARAAREERQRTREPNTRPSREREAYVGTYTNAAYGPCRITLEAGRLVWRWGAFRGILEHYHHDTFTVTQVEPAAVEFPQEPLADFTLGGDGTMAAVRVLDVDFKKMTHDPHP